MDAKDTAKGVAAMGAAVLLLATPVVSKFEGWRNDPYRDVGNVLTVCAGHTGGIQARRYSDDECRALLQADLAKHADLIRPCVPAETPAESQAAFLSIAFNIGGPAFCRSTIAKRLKAGDLAGACQAMAGWVMVKGKRVQGLVNRRNDEMTLCRKGLPA